MSDNESERPKPRQFDPAEIDQLKERLIAESTAAGLYAGIFHDEPNEVSAPHAHGATTLLTLEGSAQLRLDGNRGDWQQATPGTITKIGENQLHEAVAGPEGWSYLFISSHQEARRQGLIE